MISRDYSTARYRIWFAYGARPRHLSGNDTDAVRTFDDLIDAIRDLLPTVTLVQKGIAYLPKSEIAALRQTKRGPQKRLASYANRTEHAEQAGFYVFDCLSPSCAPTFLANLHWTASRRFGSAAASSEDEADVGRFAVVALERSVLTHEASNEVDRLFSDFFPKFGGLWGGVYADRPYVWNGVAGIEWMYREMTQASAKTPRARCHDCEIVF